MHGYVAVTDIDWFRFLAVRGDLDEVNFWRPSDLRTPRRLVPGMPFIFKLRKQYGGWIVGYGVFAKHRVLPAWLAWDTFAEANGAGTFAEMRARIERLRPKTAPRSVHGEYEIGCLMLAQPIFLPNESWIRPPADWPENTVQGSDLDLVTGEGARIWTELLERAVGRGGYASPHERVGEPRRGAPMMMRPRLGQGLFRISVLDAYGGSCAVTGEHSLPVLEAAHIRPFADDGPHEVTNGLLLRSDLHRLFDRGYVGVSPDLKFVVSDRLREDYNNGRTYYPLRDQPIVLPKNPAHHPDRDQLAWHLESVVLR